MIHHHSTKMQICLVFFCMFLAVHAWRIPDKEIWKALDKQNNLKNYYRDKVVFLTGGSGCFGGNILYQLTDLMNAKKIFVLTRNAEDTWRKWEQHMPEQVGMYKQLEADNRIVMVNGDATRDRFGIDDEVLRVMEDSVHIIINSAANTAFNDNLKLLVQSNCEPVLKLVKMAEGDPKGERAWKKLESFIHVSTAYVNTFMEGKEIQETIYAPDGKNFDAVSDLRDAEIRLQQIQAMKGDAENEKGEFDRKHYLWPYAESKHLAERLLTGRFPYNPERQWNVLIARCAIIGPAIMYPYQGYGPIAVNPATALLERLMNPNYITPQDPNAILFGNDAIFIGQNEGSKTLDETPSDVIAAYLLALIPEGQTGVVHLTSELYKPRKAADLLTMHNQMLPTELTNDMRTARFYTAKTTRKYGLTACPENFFYKLVDFDYRFKAATCQKVHPGTINIAILKHKFDEETMFAYDWTRIAMLLRRNPQWLFRELTWEDREKARKRYLGFHSKL